VFSLKGEMFSYFPPNFFPSCLIIYNDVPLLIEGEKPGKLKSGKAEHCEKNGEKPVKRTRPKGYQKEGVQPLNPEFKGVSKKLRELKSQN